jgi:hypothetical protein
MGPHAVFAEARKSPVMRGPSLTHTLENRLRPEPSGAWDWGVGGAPGTHQLWPTMIRHLCKIAHLSREQRGLSPLFTVGKPATRSAGHRHPPPWHMDRKECRH